MQPRPLRLLAIIALPGTHLDHCFVYVVTAVSGVLYSKGMPLELHTRLSGHTTSIEYWKSFAMISTIYF